MSDFTVNYRGNFIEVQTGYGNAELDLGRPSTWADARIIETMMNLGARMYAEDIRQARLVVDDLIHWRKS